MWEPTCGHHEKKRAGLLPRVDMMSNGYFSGRGSAVSKSGREKSLCPLVCHGKAERTIFRKSASPWKSLGKRLTG